MGEGGGFNLPISICENNRKSNTLMHCFYFLVVVLKICAFSTKYFYKWSNLGRGHISKLETCIQGGGQTDKGRNSTSPSACYRDVLGPSGLIRIVPTGPCTSLLVTCIQEGR